MIIYGEMVPLQPSHLYGKDLINFFELYAILCHLFCMTSLLFSNQNRMRSSSNLKWLKPPLVNFMPILNTTKMTLQYLHIFLEVSPLIQQHYFWVNMHKTGSSQWGLLPGKHVENPICYTVCAKTENSRFSGWFKRQTLKTQEIWKPEKAFEAVLNVTGIFRLVHPVKIQESLDISSPYFITKCSMPWYPVHYIHVHWPDTTYPQFLTSCPI